MADLHTKTKTPRSWYSASSRRRKRFSASRDRRGLTDSATKPTRSACNRRMIRSNENNHAAILPQLGASRATRSVHPRWNSCAARHRAVGTAFCHITVVMYEPWPSLIQKSQRRGRFPYPQRSGASSVSAPARSSSGTRKGSESWFVAQGAIRPRMFIGRCFPSGRRRPGPWRRLKPACAGT